jgi:DNA invertase Pin-like site-specific DNA recombinase
MRDMAIKARARILGADEVREARDLLAAGWSQARVAEVLSVDRSTLKRALDRSEAGDFGRDRATGSHAKRYTFLTDEQRAEATTMLEAGDRVMAVAKRFGVDRKTIRNLRPDHIPSPPRGRPVKVH